MEDIKDFETFYTRKLLPFFSNLKLQSNNAAKWSAVGIAAIILATFCFMMNKKFIGVIFIILSIVSIYNYFKLKDLFTDNYKRTIIREIINYLNPGLIYKPNGYISSTDYKKSGLFRHRYDYYFGSDFIRGLYKNFRFSCSELNVKQDRYSSNHLNKHRLIFKGLFFTAPVNRQFAGGTYLWPRDDEQLANSIMDEHYRLFPLPKVYHVKMNTTSFENHFSVYSTNPSEARMILDEEMMRRVVNFKNQIMRDVRLSIVAGICYVAISIEEDLLEPALFEPENKEDIKDCFFSVLLIFSIINQLNLSRLI